MINKNRHAWAGASALCLSLSLAFAACSKAQGDQETVVYREPPPPLELRYEVESRLGAQGSEAVLGQIRFVRTDSQGRVYVADRASASIKIFSPQGRFLRSLGRRGKDSGEFHDLTAVGVDARDRLIVIDALNRRITRFSPDWEVESEREIPARDMLLPRQILALDDSHTALLFQMSAGDWGDDHLLHVFDLDLKQESAGLIGSELIAEDGGAVAQAFSQAHLGFTWIQDPQTVLFSPRLYNGSVYRFVSGERGWKRQWEGRGHLYLSPSISAMDSVDDTPEGEVDFNSTSQSGRLFGRLNNESRGIFSLSDGRVVHFTYIRSPQRRRVFGVEAFSPRGEFLGYAPLAEQRDIMVYWKDSQDRFYWAPTERLSELEIVRLKLTPAGASPLQSVTSQGIPGNAPGDGDGR